MRQIILVNFALLIGIAPCAFADQWTKTFAVTARPDLHVNANDGDVRVTAGDVHDIRVRVDTVGWKIGPSEVRVVDRQTGNRVEIDIRMPKIQWNLGHRSITIAIEVPRDINAEIHTGDGRISAQGLHGATKLTTGDGRIETELLDGTLEAESGDGRLTIHGRFDSLNLKTGDGNIEARLSPGSKMTQPWRVHTGDGHVTLALPEGFAADLDAHTGDGQVSVEIPITVSGSPRGSTTQGKLNGGGPVLTVRSGDGAIRINKS